MSEPPEHAGIERDAANLVESLKPEGGKIVMPMMALVHPMVQSGMMPAPGFFLAGMATILAPLGSLIGHLVYGAVLGTLYGRPDAESAA